MSDLIQTFMTTLNHKLHTGVTGGQKRSNLMRRKPTVHQPGIDLRELMRELMGLTVSSSPFHVMVTSSFTTSLSSVKAHGQLDDVLLLFNPMLHDNSQIVPPKSMEHGERVRERKKTSELYYQRLRFLAIATERERRGKVRELTDFIEL